VGINDNEQSVSNGTTSGRLDKLVTGFTQAPPCGATVQRRPMTLVRFVVTKTIGYPEPSPPMKFNFGPTPLEKCLFGPCQTFERTV